MMDDRNTDRFSDTEREKKKFFKRIRFKRPYMFFELIINSSLMCFELLSRVFQNIDRQSIIENEFCHFRKNT